MKTLKSFEEVSTVNKKDIGSNWSADFQINKQKGKKPYKKKTYELTLMTKSISKDAIYLTEKQAEELNELGSSIKDMINK